MRNHSLTLLAALALGLPGAAFPSYVGITDLTSLPNSAFGAYGLIVQGVSSGTNHLGLTSDTHLNTDVAVADNASVQGAGVKINGYYDDAASSGGNITNVGASTINTSVAQADNAVTDAVALYHAYTSLTGPNSPAIITSTTLNVSSNAGTAYNGNSNEHVYTITNGNSSNQNFSITASATDYVIIDVTGTGDFKFDNVTLTGISSDHVLFNIEATGNLQGVNGDTVNADIIDLGGSVNFDAATINGRLACATTANNCQVVSGATINASINTQATPEPATFGFAALALGMVCLGARRRSRA